MSEGAGGAAWSDGQHSNMTRPLIAIPKEGVLEGSVIVYAYAEFSCSMLKSISTRAFWGGQLVGASPAWKSRLKEGWRQRRLTSHKAWLGGEGDAEAIEAGELGWEGGRRLGGGCKMW